MNYNSREWNHKLLIWSTILYTSKSSNWSSTTDQCNNRINSPSHCFPSHTRWIDRDCSRMCRQQWPGCKGIVFLLNYNVIPPEQSSKKLLDSSTKRWNPNPRCEGKTEIDWFLRMSLLLEQNSQWPIIITKRTARAGCVSAIAHIVMANNHYSFIVNVFHHVISPI